MQCVKNITSPTWYACRYWCINCHIYWFPSQRVSNTRLWWFICFFTSTKYWTNTRVAVDLRRIRVHVLSLSRFMFSAQKSFIRRSHNKSGVSFYNQSSIIIHRTQRRTVKQNVKQYMYLISSMNIVEWYIAVPHSTVIVYTLRLMGAGMSDPADHCWPPISVMHTKTWRLGI